MSKPKRTVFISWSGAASRIIAGALRDWLPQVLQNLDPFMSEHDIAKGSRGQDELASRLREAEMGLICLTPDNLDAPWVLFEAGALSNSLANRELVCPYLIGLKKKDVPPPLSLFQLADSTEDDTLRLVTDMNAGFDPSVQLTDQNLARQFTKWWPELAVAIQEAAETVEGDAAESSRSPDDILAEVLETVRRLEREVSRDPPDLRQADLPVYESEPPPPSFAEGERVVHPTFGAGVIMDISGTGSDQKAEVDFVEKGRKRLLLRYARLRSVR